MSTSDFIKKYFFNDGKFLNNRWDGIECANYLTNSIKHRETLIWTVCLFLVCQLVRLDKVIHNIYKLTLASKDEKLFVQANKFEKFLDKIFFICCLITAIFIYYYKINMQYGIFLLQPCHITITLQTIAFIFPDTFGTALGLFWFAMVVGTASALIFPDTTMLHQPYEPEFFWIEHIVAQIVPLYLLIRRGGLVLKHLSWRHWVLGNVLVMFLHWWVFHIVDSSFTVNVNYFLCPSEAIEDNFKIFNQLIPSYLSVPTYRTFFMFTFIGGSVPFCLAYYIVAHILVRILYPKSFYENKKIKFD